MNKKKILLLVGGVAVIVIVVVVTQYLAMRSDGKKDAIMPQTPIEDINPVAFTTTTSSYAGTIQSIDAEKIVIVKEDGGTEEYQLSVLYGAYDNRVRDEMKPIDVKNLEKDMRVQVSTTLKSNDDTKIVTLVVL